MNWYKKQLIKIADSCISNRSYDINTLSDMLHSDFNIHMSKKKIENTLEKIAANDKKNSPNEIDEIVSDMSSSLSSRDTLRLKDILLRYSQIN
ncbi:hypothetical protein CMI45_01250 [Candidatus Pacearchaeota archaeon]|nr:hypothetical protein [Candidatus Pacearchaeota archaeon]|tara:strand:+ start:64 stop:342 length:279 start_codon:yes stop_codon:yes gene_type:complete